MFDASSLDSSSLVTLVSVWRLLLTLGLLLVSYYVYRFVDLAVLQPYRRYRLLAQQGIKGPPFYPLIGNLLTLRRYHTAGRRLDFSSDNRQQYGSVHQFMLGPFNMLSMSDPDYVLAAWKAQSSHYHKGVLTKTMMAGLVGTQSLLLIDEPQHAKHRKMLAPAFHYAKLHSMVSIMVAETQRKVDALLSQLPPASQSAQSAPSLSVDVHHTFTELTFNIIMSSSFGNSLQTIPHASATIARALTVTLPIVQRRQLALIEYLPVLRDLPVLGKQEAVQGVSDMNAVVMQMVQDRRAGRSHSNCPGEDLLDILLNARDPDTGEAFPDEQIRSDALTFVVAGQFARRCAVLCRRALAAGSDCSLACASAASVRARDDVQSDDLGHSRPGAEAATVATMQRGGGARHGGRRAGSPSPRLPHAHRRLHVSAADSSITPAQAAAAPPPPAG